MVRTTVKPFEKGGTLAQGPPVIQSPERSTRTNGNAPGVHAEAVRVAHEGKESEGRIGSRRQRPWWTPVSPATAVADGGEVTR